MVTNQRYPATNRWKKNLLSGIEQDVYLCDCGRERSVNYAFAAKDRGEKASFAEGGMWGIWNNTRTVESCIQFLQRKYANTQSCLRLIVDGNSHPQGFVEAVKKSGLTYEVIRCSDVRSEMIEVGQDWEEYN